MKIGLMIFLCFFLCVNAFAQNFEWAKSMGSVGNDVGKNITTDANGNVYTTGGFRGTVDFDPSSAVFDLTSLGVQDVFIQKLDPNGNLLWAKSMGSTGVNNSIGRGIGVDSSGNVYTVGDFEGIVDFDPGSGTFNLTANGSNSDIFIQKLDANGNFIWAKSMGSSDLDTGDDLCVDAGGNSHITGSFRGTVDFDPGIGVFNLTANSNNSDIFVQKLDANGNLIWAKSMGGNLYETGRGISIDLNGNVYTTGYFQGTVDFDPGVGTFNLTFSGSIGFSDVFIQKLDVLGNFVWAKKIGGIKSDIGFSIIIDNNGGVYTTGHFRGVVDFDPGAGVFNLTANGVNTDIFILKLDANGNFAWAKSMGGTDSDQGLSIAVDYNRDVYTTGTFDGTVDFDPGAGIFNLSANGSNSDIFIQKLDANGNFVWAKSIGGMGNDIGLGITIEQNRNIYIIGGFSQTVDFDPGAGVFNLTSLGNNDVFIQKIRQCTPSTRTDNQIACNSYTWINGITYTSSNNTATDTLTNTGGCDSIVTLDLTILGANQIPYQESFTGTFPPLNTSISNPDNSNTWIGAIWTATNGSTDDMMYIDYSAYNAAGQKDYFVLPLLDLDTVTIAELSFDVSYNPYSVAYSDSLAVEISTDCGLTYQSIYMKGGLDLSIDNNYLTSVWIPDNTADWRKERIDLTPYLGNKALVRFVGINGYGNNLYLDNINVGLPIMTDITKVKKAEFAKIYPTPTKDYLTLELLENSEDIQLQIVDVNAKVVLSQFYETKTTIQLSVEHLVTGIYFVKIESNKSSQVIKMVKE